MLRDRLIEHPPFMSQLLHCVRTDHHRRSNDRGERGRPSTAKLPGTEELKSSAISKGWSLFVSAIYDVDLIGGTVDFQADKRHTDIPPSRIRDGGHCLRSCSLRWLHGC